MKIKKIRKKKRKYEQLKSIVSKYIMNGWLNVQKDIDDIEDVDNFIGYYRSQTTE